MCSRITGSCWAILMTENNADIQGKRQYAGSLMTGRCILIPYSYDYTMQMLKLTPHMVASHCGLHYGLSAWLINPRKHVSKVKKAMKASQFKCI